MMGIVFYMDIWSQYRKSYQKVDYIFVSSLEHKYGLEYSSPVII